MAIFDTLDIDGDETIDANELKTGLEQSRTIKLTQFKLKALMRAADANHDNCIDRDEWKELAVKAFEKHDCEKHS